MVEIKKKTSGQIDQVCFSQIAGTGSRQLEYIPFVIYKTEHIFMPNRISLSQNIPYYTKKIFLAQYDNAKYLFHLSKTKYNTIFYPISTFKSNKSIAFALQEFFVCQRCSPASPTVSQIDASVWLPPAAYVPLSQWAPRPLAYLVRDPPVHFWMVRQCSHMSSEQIRLLAFKNNENGFQYVII